ncbi:MAG: hypothetical protein M3N21_06465 [Actinomycetota bacterium]|nr:hypothetical protein [Actinomycetota bacterium]
MHRKSFDALLSAAGLVVATVVLAASGLLFWGHSFVASNVHSQLAAQRIFMPPAGSPALADPAVGPYLNRYAGQQIVNGDQARAYADHFIAVHLRASGGGRTYAELSAAAQAAPTDTALAGKVASSFRGETLRGLLLNAYAFGKMGQLALVGALGTLFGGLILLILTALGIRHARHTPMDVPLHVPGWHPEQLPAS